MNQKDSRFDQTRDIILKNQRFLIVANGQFFDSLAAASGLADLLKSMGKDVTLYSPSPVQELNLSQLSGSQNFVEDVSGKSNELRITFNCPLEDIEKVDSTEDNDRLSLKIEFRNETKLIDPSQIEIKQGAPKFDAGFVLDPDWEDEVVNKGDWIYVSRTGVRKNWAKVNVVESKGSISESIISLISRGEFQIPAQSAYNFYLGIKKATAGFEKADSIALETAAYCLRIKEKAGQQEASQQRQAEQAIEQKAPETPLSEVETKEGKPASEIGKPPVFTGATTPKS